MTVIDIAQEHSQDELETLAQSIRQDELDELKVEELRSFIQDASDEQQREAIDINPAFNDLVDALDLPLPAPKPGIQVETEPAEPDEEVEVIEDRTEKEPTMEEAEDANRLANLDQRFPRQFIRDQYRSLEQARQNAFPNLSPEAFYESHAEEVATRKLRVSKQEFVAAQAL